MKIRDYRPDIDGLRAIAVVSVLLHHLNPSLLPGGFVGVDVFFVISGYLITGQIANEIQTASFSIRNFYQRRINRIIPALFTVIFATIVAGLMILSPGDLKLLARSAAYSIFGISNIFFWREYGNYFAANSSEAPLLHTWSLGVEEQFYAFWPLLLLLSFKITKWRAHIILLPIFFIALFLSEIGLRFATSAAYYLLPTRFFELMVGGLLALLGNRIRPANPGQSGLAFFLGLFLVIGSLYWIDKSTPFPGINGLWACLGTALLLWSGMRQFMAHRLLTFRPMVFVGLVSYSLYLWHWPLIAFSRYVGINIDFVAGIVLSGLAILLSWFSWKFVETPLRRSGASIGFPTVLLNRFVAPAAVLLILSASMVLGQGFPGRFDSAVARLEAAQNSKPNELRSGCHVPTALYDTPPTNRCQFGTPKSMIDGILLGDSFANHFTGMLDVLAKHDGLSLMDYTMDGCPPIIGYKTKNIATYAEKCQLRNEIAYEFMEKHRFKYVILAASWPNSPEVGSLVIRSVERIMATGAELIIIMKNQSIVNADTCAIKNLMYSRTVDCTQPIGKRPPYFDQIQSRYPSVRFIDPNLIICGQHGCNPMLDGNLIYRDSSHLNDGGSRLLGEKLLRSGVHLVM